MTILCNNFESLLSYVFHRTKPEYLNSRQKSVLEALKYIWMGIRERKTKMTGF